MTQFALLNWVATAVALFVTYGTAVVLLVAALLTCLLMLRRFQARNKGLELLNAITGMAAGSEDYSGMTRKALLELCRFCGAGYAWFEQVERDELVLREHVGLPDWYAVKHSRVSIHDSSNMLSKNSEAATVSLENLPEELRRDLQKLGIRFVIAVPVMGKTSLTGVLALGPVEERRPSSEQLDFLKTAANQLGTARENLQSLDAISRPRRKWVSTVDSIDDYILVHDAEFRVLRLNRALRGRLGHPSSDLSGQPLSSVLPNAEEGCCPYCEMANRNQSEVEDPCFGGYSTVSTSSFVEDDNGRVSTAHIICDRTERHAGEERYRLLFESVKEAVFVSTPEGKLIDHNPAFASLLGYKNRAELLAVDIGSDLFVNPEQRAAYLARMEEQGYLRNYEVSLRRKDGRIVTVLENSFASRDGNGEIVRYQGFLVDITEKKRVEQEMQRRNRELGALNAMATIATRTFDLDAILQNTLQWTTELFGQQCDILLFDLDSGQLMRCETSRENRDQAREELRSLVEREEISKYIKHVQSEVVTEQELPRLPAPVRSWLAKYGCESFVAVMIGSQRKTLGIFLVSSPLINQFTETDRNLAIAIARQLGNSVEKVLLYEETALAYDNLRNAQEQLLQSEKMSAVGQFISGVAHELNNPLTAVLGYAQLLETEPLGERAQDYLRKLYLQTQRTHRVVQNLLSFSRQRKPLQSQVDLRHVLENTLTIRATDFKLNNVTLERCYEPEIPFITGDAHQLEQVFLNIINNALDAMMDSSQTAGYLRVRLYTENDRVCIEFRDSGSGLKNPSKIFDPFYTTKKIGKGIGLGLSICYGIVKEHGGDITAFNHEQRGAVFQLKLPVAGPRKDSGSTVPTQSGQTDPS